MIAVALHPEPKDFGELVRKPGKEFLKATPKPTAKQFRTRAYWRHILPALHDAYKGICAYSCHWIPYDTGADTVEHFKSKVKTPKLAYEWKNYRLVCGTLNGRKQEFTDVADPFHVQSGEFVLEFPSLIVKPGKQLKGARLKLVESTIARLQLNDEGTCLKSRIRWVLDYCDKGITFDYLAKCAPFIAYELRRQRLVSKVVTIMRAKLRPI